MVTDNIVGVVFKTPYVKHHELFWFCIDFAAILALTDEGCGLEKTVDSSCDYVRVCHRLLPRGGRIDTCFYSTPPVRQYNCAELKYKIG